MTDDYDSVADRREAIEERLRLISEAEQKAWIKAALRTQRRWLRQEAIHQRRLQALASTPPDTISPSETIAEMYARFTNAIKRPPRNEPSRLLNPDLAALDEERRGEGHPGSG